MTNVGGRSTTKLRALGRFAAASVLLAVVAGTTAQAGPGELVFIIASREAALALPETFVPVDHAIVGIVDDVDVR